MTKEEREAQYEAIDQAFRADAWDYFYHIVKIKPKVGDVVPFKGNRSQREVHNLLEEQKRKTGMVRAIILKGRQLGISTYIAARFYRQSSFYPGVGVRSYIMTHESIATGNLFGMAKRMHDFTPQEYKHELKSSNANELEFKGIESGYRVGTAGTRGTGRSQTVQQFHASELAFWENADEHFSGALQAVPEEPGTEIVIESTANGVGGKFYDQWQLAESGDSEYIAIFLPWFWEPKYRRGLPEGFSPSYEEVEYGRLYELDAEQVCWMHYKNIQLGGMVGILGWLFKREYPANAQEAFQTSGEESLISVESVMKARKNHIDIDTQDYAIDILGVDIARQGKDKTRIIDRRGRKLGGRVNLTLSIPDLMVIADKIAHCINDFGFDRVYIDLTGMGSGVYDRLNQLGYGSLIVGVEFGSTASEPDKYINKRTEMACRLKDWLDDSAGVDIPDCNVLHRHFCSADVQYDANSRSVLEKKDSIKKRLGFSPDGLDAAGLTFTEISAGKAVEKKKSRDHLIDQYISKGRSRGSSSWMSQ